MSVSSNLQSQPDWLDTFPGESISYGFDESGMWFSGDASSPSKPYPIRTNYDIDSDATVEVIYTFTYSLVAASDGSDLCPDHGICFFKADAEPYWEWGNQFSRIAVQYDCGKPVIAGQDEAGADIESEYALTINETYTARVTYNPTTQTTTHELFAGGSAVGSPVDTIVLENERLPAGSYRIGFAADTDTSERAYFTYLEISEGPGDVVTRVFRALHLPRRRREVVSEENPTPTNVQPGELLYDAENNKMYVGQDDESAVEISGGATTWAGITDKPTTFAPSAHASSHATGGSDAIANVPATASQLTADANDLALPTGDVIDISSNAARNVTGIVAKAAGTGILLVNTGSHAITLKHESTSSAAANRITVPWAGDYVLSANGGAAVLVYFAGTSRWRVI